MHKPLTPHAARLSSPKSLRWTIHACFLLLLAACAVWQPVPEEGPRPSEEERRRAVEAEQRRARDKAERRVIENVLVLRAGEAFGGEIPDLAVVHLLYATDRRATGKEDPEETYGSNRGILQRGLCAVGLSREPSVGSVDLRSVVKPKPAEDFFLTLQDRIADSGRKEVFVFVHGYNVTFAGAARRTAELAYHLGFSGVPILYSWPSQGKLAGYLVDETNVEWTIPHLKEFLAELAARSGAQAIHLIAHSMGTRALTAALRQLVQDRQGASALRFKELVLMAPDIDADVFKSQVPEIRKVVDRVTLYASAKDKALIWSKTMHGYPRAGDTRPTVAVIAGLDTIDASLVDMSLTGHFYYAENRAVLSDLFGLVRHGQPPEERFGLVPREQSGLRYWALQP